MEEMKIDRNLASELYKIRYSMIPGEIDHKYLIKLAHEVKELLNKYGVVANIAMRYNASINTIEVIPLDKTSAYVLFALDVLIKELIIGNPPIMPRVQELMEKPFKSKYPSRKGGLRIDGEE